nr:hypothetical protein CPGR_03110 [Mycolicibacterium komanii]
MGHVERRLERGERGVAVRPRLDHLAGGQRLAHVHDDTEQRVARQRPCRADRVDHLVERQILVGVCLQRGATDPAQHVTQRRVVAQIVAQHHDVDEETDELVELGLGAARDRGAQRNVRALTGFVQCDRDGRLQQHELRDTELRAQFGELAADGDVDAELDGVTFAAQHGRTQVIGCQAGVFVHTGQLLAPVLALRRDRPVGFAEQRRLPRGVVRVLDRQRRESRRLTGTPGAVRGQQVGEQHHGRPVVGGNVVDHQRHHLRIRRGEHGGAHGRVGFEVEDVPALLAEFGFQPDVVGAVGATHRDLEILVDYLVWRTVDFAIRRAQHLVPAHHVAHRLHECLGVTRSVDASRERDVVDRAGPVDAVLKPHPQLRGRHEQRPVVRYGNQSGPGRAGGRRVDPLREGGHGAQFEDLAHADVDVERTAHPGDEFGGQQGVAAEIEERVVGADAVAFEEFGEQIGDPAFRAVGRFAERGAGVDVGFGQRRPVDLAVRGDRDLVDDDVSGGGHVFGQRGSDPVADPVDVDGFDVLGRRDVADEALAHTGQIADHHDRLADAGVNRDRRRDLAEFDAVPADLDLFVGAPDEFDVAVAVAAGQVTRSVEPTAGIERVGDEPLGGQPRPVVIAVRDMCSTDVDLTDHPDRNGTQGVVEQVDLSVDLGLTDRHDAGALLALDLVPAGVDDGLGGPVEIVQQRVECGVELVGQLAGQRLAADGHALQGAPLVDAGQRQEQSEQRGYEMH